MHKADTSHAGLDHQLFLEYVYFGFDFLNIVIRNHYSGSTVGCKVEGFLHYCQYPFQVFLALDVTVEFLNLLTSFSFVAKTFNVLLYGFEFLATIADFMVLFAVSEVLPYPHFLF